MDAYRKDMTTQDEDSSLMDQVFILACSTSHDTFRRLGYLFIFYLLPNYDQFGVKVADSPYH